MTDIIVVCEINGVNGGSGQSNINVAAGILEFSAAKNITVHETFYYDTFTLNSENAADAWQSLRETGVRVIVAITSSLSSNLYITAIENDFVGYPYVWFVSREAGLSLCCDIVAPFVNASRIEAYSGTHIISHPTPEESELTTLATNYMKVYAEEFQAPQVYLAGYRAFDATLAAAFALETMIQDIFRNTGSYPSGSDLNFSQRQSFINYFGEVSFTGTWGAQRVEQSKRQREPERWGLIAVQPFSESGALIWPEVGIYSEADGYKYISDKFYWPTGYEDVQIIPTEPQPPQVLFDCSTSLFIRDDRGILKPDPLDSSSTNLLLETYACDAVYDCENWNDEGEQCGTSLKVADIVIGVFAGLIILLILLLCVLFVLCRDWGQVRARGLVHLLLHSLGSVLGIVSLYMLFGKASDGKCGALPWLLDIGASIVIGYIL